MFEICDISKSAIFITFTFLLLVVILFQVLYLLFTVYFIFTFKFLHERRFIRVFIVAMNLYRLYAFYMK